MEITGTLNQVLLAIALSFNKYLLMHMHYVSIHNFTKGRKNTKGQTLIKIHIHNA